MTLYLGEAEVARLLTPAEAFAAVEASFGRLARGSIENPERVRLEISDGVFAAMPVADAELGYAGLKTYAWTGSGTPFLVVLVAIEDTRVEAIIEADMLGQVRTAAASAVAASRLARAGATTLGVFGCGRQAASHVAALRAALPSIERVLVHGRDQGRVEAFCVEHDCEAGTPAEAGGCDIVVTATTSREPVLHSEWLQPGAFVCGVGANEPDWRELGGVVERASFVCCDLRAQAQIEAGDLIEPVGRGVLDWLEVHELHEVVTGRMQGRAHDDDIVVFKSSGLAAWDIAVGARLVELARGGGAGREL